MSLNRKSRNQTQKPARSSRTQLKSKAGEARLRLIFNTCSEEYEKALIAGGGGCAVTGLKFRKDGLPLQLNLDHRHSDGLLRGILCGQINEGLAYFDDNPQWLRAAADYLENPPYVRANGEIYGIIGRSTKKAKNRRFGPITPLNPKGTKTPQPRRLKEETETDELFKRLYSSSTLSA